jgi:hypothetical protein
MTHEKDSEAPERTNETETPARSQDVRDSVKKLQEQTSELSESLDRIRKRLKAPAGGS